MEFNDVLSLFLQSFLTAVVPLLASMLVAWAAPKVIQVWKDLKAGNPEEIYLLEQIAAMAVNAAEQEAIAGYIADRKEYAVSVAEMFLKNHGIKLDISVIAAAIEAAVKQELNPEKRFVDGK